MNAVYKNVVLAGWLSALAVIFAFTSIELRRTENDYVDSIINSRRNPLTDLAAKVGPIIAAWIPGANIAALENRLQWAGRPYNLTAELFLGIKAVLAALGAIIGGSVSFIGVPSVLTPLIAVLCYTMPDIWLQKTLEERKKKIRKELPIMLDFLIMSLRAGVELVPALERVSQQLKGPLGDELRQAWREIATGRSRAAALRAIAARTGEPDVERFVQSVIITEERGNANFTESLMEFSQYITESQKRRLEEEARKLPTKILAPIIIFIFIPLMMMLIMPVMTMLEKTIIGGF